MERLKEAIAAGTALILEAKTSPKEEEYLRPAGWSRDPKSFLNVLQKRAKTIGDWELTVSGSPPQFTTFWENSGKFRNAEVIANIYVEDKGIGVRVDDAEGNNGKEHTVAFPLTFDINKDVAGYLKAMRKILSGADKELAARAKK